MGVVARERVELPNDVEALRALVLERDARIADLEHRNQLLAKMLFEPRSERRPSASFDRSLAQGFLLFPELVEAAERVADATDQRGEVEYVQPVPKPRKKGGRRKKYPDHLPVIRTTYELPKDERTCPCGSALHEIGEETSKELERLELTIVHEIARKKYACRSCEEGVKTAAGPDRVIEKGQLGVGFLAHTLVERFGNHMPYHRLEKKYASEGLDLSRTVLWRSAHRCAELLEPIYEQMKREVLASPAIHTDDTPVTLQDSKDGGRRQARVWIYRNLEGLQVFDFTESRSRDGPVAFFGDYQGYIIADAYPGYDAFFGPEKATEVACWAHARRKYVDAEATDPELAKGAVQRIGELYGIERRAKPLEPGAVAELRQREAIPLLEALLDWLTVSRTKVLDKSPMGRAIDYTLSNWRALTRYPEDGRLPIDNNAAERSLRQVAVGRKNWMFIGNANGGRTAAVVYSLIASAKAIGVDPRMYVRDVLLRIAHENDVTTLTPTGWKQRWAPEVEEHRASIIERMLARSQGLT
jgi:transposase